MIQYSNMIMSYDIIMNRMRTSGRMVLLTIASYTFRVDDEVFVGNDTLLSGTIVGTTVIGTAVIEFGMHFGGVEVQSQILLSAPQADGQTKLLSKKSREY